MKLKNLLAGAVAVLVGSLMMSGPARANVSIQVAECDVGAACWNGPFVPWSYDLTGTDLTNLGLGTTQSLIAVQTDCCVIRLSDLQITFQTSSGPVQETAPEFNGNGVIGEVDTVANYLIPLDATSAVISGTFGNSVVSSTAAEKLYFGAVPEPAMWLMLIAGFGLVGTMLRRKSGTYAFTA